MSAAVGTERPTAPPHHEELTTGDGLFVDDVRVPGALTAVVVRSPEAHGRLLAVDASEARRMPGIHAVLTAADLRSVPAIPIRSFQRPGMATAVQPVIAHDRVRFVGEPIAVVLADDPYLAEDAAEQVGLTIDPLPPVTDAASAVPLFENRPEGNLLCRYESSHGDLESAFARAAVVVDEEFRTDRHTGVPLETRGLLAEWADERTLRLWGPTKFLSFTRRVIADWFELDEQDIHCERVDVGGMFGVRGEIYPEDFLIPWAARVVHRPVRWSEDRREHLLAVNHAPELRYRARLAMADDGRLLGFRCDVAVDMGAYVRGNGGRLVLLAIEELPGPYLWDATAIAAEGRATNKTPVGSVRAPVALESTFARERAIDLAAHRLGIDPADARRRSLVPPDAMPFTRRLGGDVHDTVLADGDYPAFLDRLLFVAGYDASRAARDGRRANGELVGVGIGLFVAHSGLGEEEQVELAVRDGRIVVSTAASDVGQGLDRMVRLVVSEALGVPGETVEVVSGTTVASTPTRGTFSSRLAIFVGNAVRDGCEQLATAALDADGEPRPWQALEGLAVVGAHRDLHATYGFGGHVAVVSVDAKRAAVTVEELTVAYDCGRALDPQSVVGQLRGGTVHGLGIALLEEVRYDENAQAVGASFMDYLLPGYADVPRVLRIELLAGHAVTNPLGVKGTGEAGVIGVGAAIANAVADALGDMGITRLPLSPPTLGSGAVPLRGPQSSSCFG